ncbi:MAG: phosphatase PAP2 family protein [Jatrophihabitans sp.]
MLLAVVVLIAVTADIHFHGALRHLDTDVGRRMYAWDLRHRTAEALPLRLLVFFGQRGVVLTIAVVIIGVLCWRQRTVDPLVRLFVVLVGLLVIVYAVKFTVTRLAPVDYFGHHPDAATHSYPSGHMANGIATWGLLAAATLRSDLDTRFVRLISVLRWIAPFAILVGMTLLNYHWISDFLGGAAAGVLVLAVALSPAWATISERLDPHVRWPR